jgi:hypothetical protein
MSKWISVEEAAAKYGINKEVIWLWAEMKRFPMSYEKGITVVDEESVEGFLFQNKDRITAEYIDTLEELCIEKANICNLYAEIIGCQDKELLCQREQIARISEILSAMERQDVRLRDCKKVLTKYEQEFDGCWIGRICANLRRLKRPIQWYISSLFHFK